MDNIFISPIPRKVCHGSTEREAGCHSRCEHFKAETLEREQKLEKIKRECKTQYELDCIAIQREGRTK